MCSKADRRKHNIQHTHKLAAAEFRGLVPGGDGAWVEKWVKEVNLMVTEGARTSSGRDFVAYTGVEEKRYTRQTYITFYSNSIAMKSKN